jgi:hypothetical protein
MQLCCHCYCTLLIYLVLSFVLHVSKGTSFVSSPKKNICVKLLSLPLILVCIAVEIIKKKLSLSAFRNCANVELEFFFWWARNFSLNRECKIYSFPTVTSSCKAMANAKCIRFSWGRLHNKFDLLWLIAPIDLIRSFKFFPKEGRMLSSGGCQSAICRYLQSPSCFDRITRQVLHMSSLCLSVFANSYALILFQKPLENRFQWNVEIKCDQHILQHTVHVQKHAGE